MLDKYGNGPQIAFLFLKLYMALLYVCNIELAFHFVIEVGIWMLMYIRALSITGGFSIVLTTKN